MKYMGLKLGPALKLCYHIERLKQGKYQAMDAQQHYVFQTTSQVHKRRWMQCSKNVSKLSFVKMDGC